MVGRVGKVMQHANLPPGLNCCRDNRVVKQLPVYYLRAGKCEENSSRANSAHSLHVKALVSTHCLVAGIPVFGEGRRVENDDLIFALLILKEIKGVNSKTRVIMM